MASDQRVPLSALGNVTPNRKRTERACLRTFTLETVKKACYRFASQGFHSLSVDEQGRQALVEFRFPETLTAAVEEEIVGHFHAELVDQDLRHSVRQQTEIVRNLILTNAFANSALVERDS